MFVGAANIFGFIFLFSFQKYPKMFDSAIAFNPPALVSSNIVLIQPDGVDDVGDYIYEIIWNDDEIIGGKISLYYDTDDYGGDGELIIQNIPTEQSNNDYYWNTANIPDGIYYIYLEYSQGTDSEIYYSDGPLKIAHPMICLDTSTRRNLVPDPSFEENIQKEIVNNWESKLWTKFIEFSTNIFSSLLNIFHKDGQRLPELGAGSNWGTAQNWFVDLPSAQQNRLWEFEWVNDPSQARTGNRAIKINNIFNGVHSDGAGNDQVSIVSPMLRLPTSGGKYLLTAWIKTDGVAAGHVVFETEYYDQDRKKLSIKGHSGDKFYVGGPETETWTKVVFLLNTPHWDSPAYSEKAMAENIKIFFHLDNSPGTLLVDDILLVEISDKEFEYYNSNNRYQYPPIISSSTPTIFSNIEGWGTTIQQNPSNGVWWLVAPNGAAFWSIGTSINYNKKLEENTGLSSDEYEMEAQYRARVDLSFNQGWRDKDAKNNFSSTHNYIDWLNFSSSAKIDHSPDSWVLKDRNGNLIAKKGHYFADVFSPIWQENAIKESQTLLNHGGWKIKNEQTIGYWTDNEWAYGDLHDFFWGDTIKLAFVDWLQGKNDLPSVDAVYRRFGSSIDVDIPEGFQIAHPYSSIDELNKNWSSNYQNYNYKSFEDIYQEKPYLRAHDDPKVDDFYAFERVIYKVYVDTIIENIRKVEDDFISSTGEGYHHIIFSNRFQLNDPASLAALQRNMDIFSRFDVIAVNWYPSNRQGTTHYSREWMDIVKNTFHDTTGRPLFISEFGVAAEDADDYRNSPYLTVARWRKKTVTHEYQRGWTYTNLVSTWANLPYVVGARWFIWANAYGNSNGSDVRNSGIVNDNDQYYVHLADNIRSVNQQINNIDRSSNFLLENINWESIEVNICE